MIREKTKNKARFDSWVRRVRENLRSVLIKNAPSRFSGHWVNITGVQKFMMQQPSFIRTVTAGTGFTPVHAHLCARGLSH